MVHNSKGFSATPEQWLSGHFRTHGAKLQSWLHSRENS